MSKVKSAIIATIVVVAIVAAAFFAVVSFPYNSGAKRWNSVIEQISLGSEFSGDAETVVYPEGVISKGEYELHTKEPELEDFDGDEDALDEALEAVTDYQTKYHVSDNANIYIDTETFGTEEGELDDDLVAELKENVASDASVVNDRLREMGYTSYSVSVVDDYGIKISVATGYNYADYMYMDYSGDSISSGTKLTSINTAVAAAVLDGTLSFRVSDASVGTGLDDTGTYTIFPKADDISVYVKKVSAYSYGGSTALKFKLTSDGQDRIAVRTNMLLDADDNSLMFYIGSTQLMSLTVESVIDSKTFYITVSDSATSRSYAAVMQTAINGETVNYAYNSANTDGISLSVTENTSGRYAAMAIAIACLVILIALCAVSVLRYKKLGWVNVLILCIYSLVMIYAVYLIGLEIGLSQIICAIFGLVLLCGVNFFVFEKVRGCVKEGNIMQNAVKLGYKRCWASILDCHIVLLIVAFCTYLIASGALSICGFVFMIATLASYALYWFTRFIWYTLSSPVKNKFAFCGFRREVTDDDD